MIAQRLLPALAVFSVAAAQSASICSQPTATINAQADVAQYTGCSTLRNVLISTTAAGVISIDGPEEITGDVTAANAGALTSFGSSTIERIGGVFTLTNLTLVSTLSFTQLAEVKEIAWSALPALDFLTFTTNVRKASKVLITNTFLSTLNGINLNTVDVLNINNNNRLREFSTQVGNITQALNIDANGRNLKVTFPNLIWAANATFRNASEVNIPSLRVVNGSLGFYGNYFQSLNAPNLTSVGRFSDGQGGLAFVANPALANITIPSLISVGGAFQIANNSALTAIDFPAVKDIGGAVDFSGNFSTPELASLGNVRGGFNLQSTAEIDCSGYKSQHSSGVIQGKFTCISATKDAKSADGSTPTGTSSGGGSSSTSKAAAVSYGINEAVAGMSVLGGLLSLLL